MPRSEVSCSEADTISLSEGDRVSCSEGNVASGSEVPLGEENLAVIMGREDRAIKGLLEACALVPQVARYHHNWAWDRLNMYLVVMMSFATTRIFDPQATEEVYRRDQRVLVGHQTMLRRTLEMVLKLAREAELGIQRPPVSYWYNTSDATSMAPLLDQVTCIFDVSLQNLMHFQRLVCFSYPWMGPEETEQVTQYASALRNALDPEMTAFQAPRSDPEMTPSQAPRSDTESLLSIGEPKINPNQLSEEMIAQLSAIRDRLPSPKSALFGDDDSESRGPRSKGKAAVRDPPGSECSVVNLTREEWVENLKANGHFRSQSH
ncbi:hypothetical protein BO78DRAFT_431680 [Aspergillus sclerotiicarbonarius CBS 121057]|uniref:Uncharacterized protein n=1 Tax=Aspergillus sclerotiicarbonarius (strain CBS 121057 / IBT 28362) TaxID=1448318 RepID=A0A319E751_ASPSB|nr:hypothetical protein BO78DRAFT_431680 [Aspergillus sclerotiicarbonarius CBS 121057]